MAGHQRSAGRREAFRIATTLLGAVLLLAPGLARGTAAPPPAPGATPEGGEAPRPALAGLTLTEALLALQARGLDLVFTSQVVRPEMRVEAEPAGDEPRAILDQLLAPHALKAQSGPGGVLVIVPAGSGAAGGPSVTGTVRSAGSLAPLAGASIQLLEARRQVRSAADGGFEIGPLAPGVYTLEAEHPDHLPARVEEIVVGERGAAEVTVTLPSMPFINQEIVVRPSRLSLLQEEPTAPLSLSRDDIEALPHLAGDLFRALSLLPGVTANDLTAQFHVHGGRRDEVQILLDGQELYEAYHLQDFDRGISVLPPGGLSGANLTTGAFPATYGDRMSGVLDMRTVTPSERRQSRLSLSLLSAVAASGGTLGRGWGGGNRGGGDRGGGDRGTWFASARRGSIDLAGRLFGKEDPSFWDLFGKVERRLDGGHHLRANLLHARDDLEFREAVDGEEKSFDTTYDSSYLWLTHQASLGQRLLVESAASWSRIDRDRRGIEDEEEQSFRIVDRRTFEVLGLTQRWGFQAGSLHAVKWGLDLRHYQAEYDYFNRFEPSFVLFSELAGPRVGITRFEERFDGEHMGLYLSDRFSPAAPLTLELGLRYDRHPLTEDTLVSPRLNAAWRPGKASVLRLAWGHFYQSQRPYELGVEDGETRFFPAERSEHWVVGYERIFGGRTPGPVRALRVEAYRRRIADPRPRYENLFEAVNFFPEAEPDRVHVVPESSRAEGIEVMVQGVAGPRVDWWVNYAYATAEDRLGGREVARPTDQTHTLNLHLSSRWGERWRVSAAWRYHTGWPTTPATLEAVADEEGEVELVPVLGPLSSERLPPYHRMDLRASRQWPLRSGRLTFFVDLQNVYNRRNVAGFDLQIDEEAEELIFEAESWPGFFPSLGLSWEF